MRRLQVGSVFFLKVMVACILRSGMSASAFTATVAGCPGNGRIVDQTVDPRLTTGFSGLSEAIRKFLSLRLPGRDNLRMDLITGPTPFGSSKNVSAARLAQRVAFSRPSAAREAAPVTLVSNDASPS